MLKTALITGVSGQDGSYLAEFLLAKEYRVVGTTRNVTAARNTEYAAALDGVHLIEHQLDSRTLVADLLEQVHPDEVYHFAGPTRIGDSWNDPAGTMLGIVMPAILLMEALTTTVPAAKCFVAGSCDTFAPEDHAQDESAPRAPTSPYGRAKLEVEGLVRKYREEHGVFAVTGILFNHESPRRDPSFVCRKIARGAARISRGDTAPISLGTVEIRRDWGFAGDYVRAMWSMLQQKDPTDLVIGSGEAHSIREFYEQAFDHVGLNGNDHIRIDPTLFRPGDAPLRLANPARARTRLGWTPEVDFERLVAMMVDYEMRVGS